MSQPVRRFSREPFPPWGAQGSPSFKDWFDTELEFPAETLMTKSGAGYLKKDAAVKLLRDEDLQVLGVSVVR